MASQRASNDIVLYNYAFSPFGKRVSTYLALRGIDYALCEQPFIMPRPDLALLPVHYRRIPILAIGRDIYLDTRLILRKLEALFPSGALGATDPQDKFVEKLLERYMVEGPIFSVTAGLLPLDALADEAVVKDRKGFLGRQWTREEVREGRGESLAYVRGLFGLLEETLLADGREWVLRGEGPRLADVEAIWAIDWIIDLQPPADIISDTQFPKLFAWHARYRAAVEKAKSTAPKPTTLDGKAAAEHVLGSEFSESKHSVDGNDPLALKEGTEVELYPADWGTEYRDRGRLIGLTPDEVTISVEGRGGVEIRVHAPRTGFKIMEIGRK
ncbi:hypothetical protein P153DRAFT_329485 [Dothidotthia symphoricarpi CBS 119687]|uniref:Uncharacterized protein n=1 Tax=Dothidotthia symphoricarpi CBS 119687 TaxID=1392245 RepID=A0A6A6AT83_9PLEO|nr:uncharacterized protein P153DRAFT_329485 [Dothidotthia symphoricarpi CBS 119687]KAF2134786.1 hypothetical protein P153DRAFT_329485 [Dothidotthia symphoricarpi CBS 119687]